MFQESLLLVGVDYLKPIGWAYKGASGFGKVLHFQSTEPCASRVQTRAVCRCRDRRGLASSASVPQMWFSLEPPQLGYIFPLQRRERLLALCEIIAN